MTRRETFSEAEFSSEKALWKHLPAGERGSGAQVRRLRLEGQDGHRKKRTGTSKIDSVRNFSLVHGIFAPSAWAGVTVATRALHASLRASYRHASPFLHTARALLALFLLASGSLAFAQTASFSYAITTLGGGFRSPVGVAVDGSGNVYIADYDNNAVKEMPAGCASSSCVTSLGGGFGHPSGVAVDGSGNVYVAEWLNNAVKELNRATPPSLSFVATTVGSTSSDSPKTVQVANIGNQPLIFAADVGSNPGYPANFPKNTSDSNLCASGTPLAQGTGCDVSMSFEPTAAGALAGSVLLTDNNLNQTNAAQRIALSETGFGVPAVTTPAPGSTLASSSATFTWTTGVGVTQYLLGIGSSGVGSYDLFNSTPITAAQASVTGLPTNGEKLYARLYSWINGAWQYNDYTYTAQ